MGKKRQSSTNILSPLRETGKDLFYYIPATIVPKAVAFLGLAIYTRLLSPVSYGRYILVSTAISLELTVLFYWLNNSLLRFYPIYRRQGKVPEFLSSIFALFMKVLLLGVGGWLAVSTVLRPHVDSHWSSLLIIGAAVLSGRAGYSLILTLAQAKRGKVKYSALTIGESISRLLLSVTFLYFLNAGVKGLLWPFFITGVVTFAYGFVSDRHSIKIGFMGLFRKSPIEFISYGFPLIGLWVGALLLSSLDRYMLQWLAGLREVGTYSAIYVLGEAYIQIFAAALMVAVPPILYNLFENKGIKKTTRYLRDVLGFYFILLIPIIFGTAVLSQEIISVFLGEGFREEYYLLPWVVGGLFFWALGGVVMKPFELMRKTGFLIYPTAISVVLNFLLNFFLIPRWAGLGAAIATFLSYMAYLLILFLLSSRIYSWSIPVGTFLRTLLSAGGMAFILVNLPLVKTHNLVNLVYHIAVGVLVYFALLFFLREEMLLRGTRVVHSWVTSQLASKENAAPSDPSQSSTGKGGKR